MKETFPLPLTPMLCVFTQGLAKYVDVYSAAAAKVQPKISGNYFYCKSNLCKSAIKKHLS
jgi:hypothetical protein